MSAIHVSGVSKIYAGPLGEKKTQALDGVSLTVEPGTAFGLIGLNGAGKTTFIKILLGIVRPNQGEVRLLGGSPVDPNIRKHIGYAPERLTLPTFWTPQSFLLSVARLKGIDNPKSRVRRQLAAFELEEVATRRIGGFSKGMKQRLGVAAALLGQPKLLVLDEPTDGVDPLGRVKIREMLIAARKQGITIFINSHLLTETERTCDRVGIISAGRLLREGSLAELCVNGSAWRVRFAPGVNPDLLSAVGFTRLEEQQDWRFEAADPSVLNAALDAARQAGGQLVYLNNEQRGLEAVLAETVGNGSP